MAKRRTKKEKERAKHQLRISWKPDSNSFSLDPVKGQFKKPPSGTFSENLSSKNARNLAKDVNLNLSKKEILKSLVLVSLILALELVIYLAWRG